MKASKVLFLITIVIYSWCNSISAQCLSGDCKNGKGKAKTPLGIYEGQFKNGNAHGKGTLVYEWGDVYVGEFKNGNVNGKGTLTYKDKNDERGEYVGKFEEGLKSGYGVMTYKNGVKYEGEWKFGEREGIGTIIDAAGKKIKGEWKNDEFIRIIKL